MSKNKYISQEFQETFERYLMDNMNKEETDGFINKLEADADFKKAFQDFKQMFLVVEEEALREELNIFHKDVPQLDSTHKKTNKTRFYLIAASITIFVFIGGSLFFNKQTPTDKLFATYFSPDPGLPTVMGNSNNYKFYEAMVDYKQANYKTAIEKWEPLLLEKPKNDTLNYFLGSAYLAEANFDKAIAFLNVTTQNSNSILLQDAYYYLGLSYLKQNNIKKAKENFEKSSNELSKEILLQITHLER